MLLNYLVEKTNRFISTIWRKIGQDTKWLIIWLLQSKFIVGVSCILFNDKSEILLLKHRYWRKDSWGLPSGNMKRGEKPEEAIVREVYEETGFIIELVRILMVSSAHSLQIEVTFIGKITGGKQQLDAVEILDADFFELDQLPSKLISRHKKLIQEFISTN